MKILARPAMIINDAFWVPRLARNAQVSIFQQWEQLQRSGCFENLRLATGDGKGLREGYFFADSDAYRWLDAAARIYATRPDPELKARMDDLIALIARAFDAGVVQQGEACAAAANAQADMGSQGEVRGWAHLVSADGMGMMAWLIFVQVG